MAKVEFVYNPDTLRYERSKITVFNVLFYSASVLMTALLFFGAFMYLQNRLVDTPVEKELRAENKALRQHKGIIRKKLTDAQILLTSIQQRESALHQKLFDTQAEAGDTYSRDPEMLLGGQQQFNQHLRAIEDKLAVNTAKALVRNQYYAEHSAVSKDNLSKLAAMPSKLPLADVTPTTLVSGFGVRINPWHKGKYQHRGIDLAAARGTNVFAAGNGQVKLVKRSNLQAGFGNYIEIDHGYGFVSRYAHLGDIVVKQGQKVTKGEVIANVGMSGGSIAPHVHFEILKDGKHLNPIYFLAEGLDPQQFELMVQAGRKQNQSLD